MTTTVETVQQTLAEYERIAIGTGQWEGTDAPQFSVDGETWRQTFIPSAENPHPLFASATVHRAGTHPIVVVVAWDEAVPADEEWRALWLRKPMALFGAFAIRAALRRAFRDVIGDRHEPDEQEAVTASTPVPDAAPRDFAAELEATTSLEEVHKLHTDAKKARAVTVALETAIRRRLTQLKAGAPATAAPVAAAMPAPKPHATPADLARLVAAHSTEQARPSKNGSRPQKPRPRRA